MSTKKKEEKKPEAVYNLTCVYTGRRLNGSGSLQRFQRPDGGEMFFRGIRRVVIGRTYQCAEKNIKVRPDPVDTPLIDNPEWDAADALVDAHNLRERAEKKIRARSSPALKEAIRALTPLMRGLASYEREALIAYLAVQASARGKKR